MSDVAALPVRARLRRTRAALVAVAVVRVVAWSVAAAAVGALGARLLGLEAAVGVRAALLAGAATAALLLAVALRHGGAAWSSHAVALWIEARVPALRYALVTLADDGAAAAVPAPVARALAGRVGAVEWHGAVRDAARRALALPVLAAIAGGATLALLPGDRAPSMPGDAGGAPRGIRAGGAERPPVDPLARLRVVVRPPAYARLATATLVDPTNVPALVGSQVTVAGEGAAVGLTAALLAPDALDADVPGASRAPQFPSGSAGDARLRPATTSATTSYKRDHAPSHAVGGARGGLGFRAIGR
jgi:hypothetical protein